MSSSSYHSDISSDSIICNGRFKVLERLGNGWFGTVYSVMDTQKGCKCALKVAANDPDAIQQLNVEFNVLKKLQNQPGIIRVYGEGVLDINGHKGILMDLKDYNLQEYICDKGVTLDATGTADIAIKLLDHLEMLHDNGVIHSDIQMNNVLVELCHNQERSGTPNLYLIDFGMALQVEKEQYCGMQWVNNRKDDLVSLAEMFSDINEASSQTLGHTLIEFMQYVYTLGDDENPDYERCKQIFRKFTTPRLPTLCLPSH